MKPEFIGVAVFLSILTMAAAATLPDNIAILPAFWCGFALANAFSR